MKIKLFLILALFWQINSINAQIVSDKTNTKTGSYEFIIEGNLKGKVESIKAGNLVYKFNENGNIKEIKTTGLHIDYIYEKEVLKEINESSSRGIFKAVFFYRNTLLDSNIVKTISTSNKFNVVSEYCKYYYENDNLVTSINKTLNPISLEYVHKDNPENAYILVKSTFQYDEESNLIKKEISKKAIFEPNYTIWNTIDYSYNENEHCIKRIETNHKGTESIRSIYFDENGNIKKEEFKYPSNTKNDDIYTYTYESFDENGNWLICVRKSLDGKEETLSREYTYY